MKQSLKNADRASGWTEERRPEPVPSAYLDFLVLLKNRINIVFIRIVNIEIHKKIN